MPCHHVHYIFCFTNDCSTLCWRDWFVHIIWCLCMRSGLHCLGEFSHFSTVIKSRMSKISIYFCLVICVLLWWLSPAFLVVRSWSRARPFGGDATVLADYALTTTTIMVSVHSYTQINFCNAGGFSLNTLALISQSQLFCMFLITRLIVTRNSYWLICVVRHLSKLSVYEMKQEVYVRQWECGRCMPAVLDQLCIGELAQRYISVLYLCFVISML